MKPLITFDQAVSALPRLPSASSRAKAVIAEALAGAGRCTECAEMNDDPEAGCLCSACRTGFDPCPGPGGLWECALEMSHEGDHVRA